MKQHKRLFTVVVFLLVLIAVFQLSGLRAGFNLAYLRQIFLNNEVASLLIFVALFALGNLIQIPGLIFLAAAVLTLGEVWGGIATYLAAVVSSVSTFWLIRLLGGDALREIDSKWARRLFASLHAHPVRNVAMLRVLMQTAPALNYTLALSGVKFRDYLIGSLVGLPLPIATYCIFFDYLARSFHIVGY